MYENVELLKKDLKRFPLPLKGKKELEALFPYVQNSQIVLCASGYGPYDSGKNCWFVLTDTNVFIVLKASMMGAPSIITVPLRDIDAAIENRGMLLSKLTLTSKGTAYTLHNAQKNDTTAFVTYFNKRKLELLNSETNVSKQPVQNENSTDTANIQAEETQSVPTISKPITEQSVKPSKKKPGCMTRILQSFLLIIILLAIIGKFSDKDGKDHATDSSSKQTTNAIQRTNEVVTPSRQKGSKAFVKANGIKIFKEAELKNILGELIKGPEIRIQEGLSSSGDLPVRYKVNVMKSGKVDIVGWLAEDTLSNPVDVAAQQRAQEQERVGAMENTAREIITKVFGKTSNRDNQPRIIQMSSIPQVDGTLTLDCRLRINDNLTQRYIVLGFVRDTQRAMQKLVADSKLSGYEEFRFYGAFPMQDMYGNVREDFICKIFLKRSVARTINWDNLTMEMFHSLLRRLNDGTNCTYWWHGAALKGVNLD